jgi:multidrug efflux pump subunit AcrA (membrane-fusion protein)
MSTIRDAVRSPKKLAVVLGLGLICALALPSISPTIRSSSDLQAAQQTIKKPVAKRHVPDAASSSSSPSNGKPATAKIEKGPFKVEVAINGVFEARRMAEVSIRPRAWTMPLVVERAIELGTPVKKGDILVELDRERIDKAIHDTEVENTLSELALKQAEEELPIIEKVLPVDLAAAERSKTQADEDLKKFLEIDRPQSERMAQFQVKQSGEYLEYSKEELRQLEKMYRSKDLTEETEEIILRRQRETMTVHAPADGLVYYGRCERGQWSMATATAQKLHKGGMIAPDEVFITVVTPRPVDVRATVDEKDLHGLIQRTELRGLVTPTFDPELRLPARLASVLPVPREAGKFEAVIAVDIGEDKTAIKPGMACTVKFVLYRKDDALTVPAGAVFKDETADTPTHYVHLAKPDKDGKFPKRSIAIGKTAVDKTEVLGGLAEGDEVLTSKP